MIRHLLHRLIALVLLFTATASHALIDLPFLLTDNAVLQRDEPIPIWGTAPPGAVVTAMFADEMQKTQADDSGNWRAIFAPREAGGPYQLTVAIDGFSRQVNGILMGDVWLCSGQSNMEWTVNESASAQEEIAGANTDQIRHFKIPHSWSVAPSHSLEGGDWRAATSNNLGEFSAVGWYFAKQIHADTKIPIGLINATWGGSRIEAWMNPQALGIPPETAQQTLATMVASGEARAREVKNLLSRWPGALSSVAMDSSTDKRANADWSGVHVDENNWLQIQVPGLWETQQFTGVDGVMWYRKSFNLSEAQAAADLTLSLGRIDDNDITWVNGREVGSTNAYDKVRVYSVPANYLKPGKNQLAIRVDDTGGGGGIYSSADLIYWQSSDGVPHALAGEWHIKADKVSVAIQDTMHHTSTALYNKMVHPLFNIPIKGVLWYQGESNANSAEEATAYRQQFPSMIKSWRTSWDKADLPFYWVQLANFISGHDTENTSPWAILRDAQTATLALNNTGQAITIDVGNPNDIHPTDKKTVGDRLARIALNKTYREKKTVFRGPVFHRAKLRKNQLILRFKASEKLRVRDNAKPVMGFEIAGDDGQFSAVNGTLRNNQVILPLENMTSVSTVRYAWSDNPEKANLIDAAGLPAEPFKADL